MRRHLLTLGLTGALAACGSDAGLTPYTPQPMAFHALADVALKSGDGAVSLPLAEQTASATILTGAGCTASVEVETAAADGTCALRLRFGPRSDGPGMALVAATLDARGAAGTCAPLSDRLPAGEGAVQYTLDTPGQQGRAWLPWVTPAPGDGAPAKDAPARGAPVAIDKLLVETRGAFSLSAGDDTLQLGDRAVQLGGDVVATQDASATCAPCASDACKSPYPPFRLREVQPASVAHNLEVGLDRWLGQTLVVILTQGW